MQQAAAELIVELLTAVAMAVGQQLLDCLAASCLDLVPAAHWPASSVCKALFTLYDSPLHFRLCPQLAEESLL